MLRLPRLMPAKYALSPDGKNGPNARASSPTPGRSIFTTSAPRSASNIVQYGPAKTRVRSRTLIPASGKSSLVMRSAKNEGECGGEKRRSCADSNPESARPLQVPS